MVTEEIRKLHGRLTKISAGYAVFQRRETTDLVRQDLAPVQEFVTWIMQENPIGLEPGLHGETCRDLLGVLQDMLEALRQDDKVLMHDAVEYGLLPYLRCFPGVSEKEGTDDTV